MSSTTLQGQLGEGVVANILQYLSLNQAQGCLTLEATASTRQTFSDNTRRVGKIFLEDGRVVHIEGDGVENIAALARISAWQEGNFYFSPNTPIEKRTMRMAVDQLLLQAAYEADTGDFGLHDLQPNTIISNTEGTIDTQTTTLNISVKSLSILRFVDGIRSLEDIVKLSNISFDELRVEILNLLSGGVVEVLDETLNDDELYTVWYRAYENLNRYVEAKNKDPLRLTWGRVANQLVDEYPTLDPFTPDIKFTNNGLERLSDQPMKTVLPALLAASIAIARHYGLNRRGLTEAMALEDLSPLELRISHLANLMPVQRS